MGRKKINDFIEQEPLSNYQDTTVTGRTDEVVNQRVYKIRDAAMKDGICNYSYEITKGVGYGDVHKVKGTAFYLADLGNAFTIFNVHMAFIDDAFKLSGMEVSDIDTMHNDNLAFQYNVTGFSVTGDEDNESIVLTGIKHVSMGHFDIKSPKILIGSSSSYKWYNELKAAADKAREEVALYKEGKCEVVEEAIEEDPKQIKMFGGKDYTISTQPNNFLDEDFAEAAR